MSSGNKFSFLVDENLHRDIAHFLRNAGCEAAFIPKGFKNGSVYRAALTSRRILLSGDKDFLETAVYPPKPTRGIVLVRIHPPDPAKVIPVLGLLLKEFSPKDIRGKLICLEPAGARIVSPPRAF